MRKLFFLIAFLLFTQAGFAWWSDGANWTSRKPISLNNSGSALTDYQVKVELNWTSGMNATFTDLRFTDNSTNGVSLPFWIENYTASVNATVWVKTNLSTGNNTVYVYYGNPAALSTSNISTTMIFGDDFNRADGAIGNGWTVGTGSANVLNNQLNFTNAATGYGRISIPYSGANTSIAIHAKAKQNPNWFFAINYKATATDNDFINALGGGMRFVVPDISINDHTNQITTAYTYATGVWYNWQYAVTLNPNYVINVTVWAVGTAKPATPSFNKASFTPVATGNNIRLGINDGSTPTTYYVDDVFVRQYVSPEPVVLTVGSEEAPPITITIQSPVNKTYNTATIDLNFTLSTNASSCIYELDGVNTTITGCQNTTLNILPQWNYKATANSYTCIGNFSGDYGPNCEAIDDNNFGTYTRANLNEVSYVLYNYSYDTQINSIFLEVMYGVSTCNTRHNISVPTSCFFNPLEIKVTSNYTAGGTSSYSCKNSTDWIILETSPADSFCSYIYEVGLWVNNSRSHSIKVWANDSANNWGVSSTVSFTVDTTLPSAAIQLPANATYNKLNGSVTLNFTTSDNLGVSQCKYELDGVNTSLPTCSNTTLTLTDGSHRIKVWVNDTANNWNSTPLIYFVSDFTEPNINIQSPTNSTYTISTVALNFTIGESVGLSTCKYELDGINTTISCTANTTISGLSHGGHSIKIWANDTAGNMNNSATISFSNDIVLYVYVYDETTPTQNITFNLTLSNSTASKTANNQVYYTGNFTADPRGSLTLTLSAAGYNSRTFYTTWDGTAKVNYTAYLLTGTNQYTFYIKNANSVAIEGAVVTIKRSINNVLQTVGEATTDTAGTVLFTLTPNIVYTVQVVASNYNTHTGTILPTQASYTYTITLSSSTSTPNFQQVWNGIRYTYQPAFTILKNAVNTFNFTIYSIVDGLTSYGMNISINGTIVSSQTGNTSTGGSISATVDLRNYTTEAGYARLWFTKTGMPTQVIQPDKNFNVHTNPTSNISASAIAINFGNTAGITEQTKFMISVITSIIMMAVTAGFGAGRNGSAIIGLLVFGAFVWVGWVPALYLTFGVLFVFAILIIKGAY